jgi:hypothetical protein
MPSVKHMSHEMREPANRPPSLEELRRAHHLKAPLLGLDRDMREVAAICDTTPEHLEQLAADPSFQELIGYYRGGGTFKLSRR